MLTDDITVDVYNADYRALDAVPWREAIGLIHRRAVTVVEVRDPVVLVRSPSLTMELPASVSLRRYVHRPYRPPAPTRMNVFRRDRRTCMYCGGPGDTLDHILPRCRGGSDTWINLVTACKVCNGFKDDRTPEEAGMRLLREPFEPEGTEKFWFPELV